MIVLDTNVISELMKASADVRVQSWLDRQPAGDVWTTSITVFEIRSGLSTLAQGKRRDMLHEAWERVLSVGLGRRIIELDQAAAEHAAEIFGACQRLGTPIDFRDLLIAGGVSARSATLATRNVRHFVPTGIPLVDPWSD